MSDATKAMLVGIIRHLLTIAGGALAAHGLINSSGIETFVSLGLAAAGVGWSIWDKYGRDIVTAQLEVWKAQALAQRDAMRKANVPQPSHAEVAASVPDPAVTAAVVAKVIATGCLLLAALLLAAPAFAQPDRPAGRRPALTGNIVNDIRQRADSTDTAQGTDAGRDKIMGLLAKPFRDLADFIGQDAEDAITLSTAIPGIQDGHGQQCWIAARNFTAVIKAHPLPLTGGGMRDLEALRLLNIAAKRLCEDSHCTQVFTDLKNAAITIAQTGFGAIGAATVRGVPGLQDVCTQIPNVPLADPISPVPPAPDVKPIGLGTPQ